MPSSVHLLATKKVRERWSDQLLDQYLPTKRPDGSRFERKWVDIPDGNGREDQWRIVAAVVGLLDEARQCGEDVDVDITHGFRVLPVLVIAATNFARARWRMRDALAATPDEHPQLRIFYGAFEAKDSEGRAPIWDMTGVLGAAEWADALRAFVSFGRADDLEALATSEAKALPAEVEQQSRGALKGLGKQARAAADDLVTVRTINLLSKSLPQLIKTIGDERQAAFVKHRPILHDTLTEFSAALQHLTASEVGSLPGVKASLDLAELLGRMQRYSEQSTLLRETAVTLLALRKGLATGISGGKVDKHVRNKADRAFGNVACDAQTTKDPSDARAHSLSQDRNDIQHAGLNPQPAQAKDLISRLTQTLNGLREQFELYLSEGVQNTEVSSPLLVNLSNHPLTTWTSTQREAAERIAPLAELEAGLPLVAPDLSTDEVIELAKKIAKKATSQGATSAAVFGEPVLTFALVSELESRGVVCWAPAGRRNVASELSDGAAVHIQRTFEFHSWRRYRSSSN